MTYCVDPISTNINSLDQNIRLNRLEDQIQTICEGVGECQKEVEIQIEGNLKTGEGTGAANILVSNTTHPCERLTLQITTIDDLIENRKLPGNCSLMKIDVDGYDLKVLQGATKLLSTNRPIVYGEFLQHCLSWHGQSHVDVINFAGSYDYEVHVQKERTWKFEHRTSYKGTRDLLLVPKEKLAELSWCLH
ncbi:MAG: FkbM family methyltransferase [Gammaproteobacteria bacterium]|nr:FkbM family methyltransferase [Gammaproteobacteria bacterium]